MIAHRIDLPRPYRGRFAPSPSGPLHDGSLIAAMASFLDARAHGGQWLVRIEDIDAPRVTPGADQFILHQLQTLGMHWDEPPIWQQQRLPRYQQVFESLAARGLVYGCGCTRQEITQAAAQMAAAAAASTPALVDIPPLTCSSDRPTESGLTAERPYPGTCRNGLPPGRQARAWRLRIPPGIHRFNDRWMGPQQQDVAHQAGDIILKRADGLWAYQFVVVVDDGDQGITDIVRGADLLDSTPRQQILAGLLGMPIARTLHVPLALATDGRKLSKQNHAPALDLSTPLRTLDRAWRFLGFDSLNAASVDDFWQQATTQWAQRFGANGAIA